MTGATAGKEIDAILKKATDWRGVLLSELRALILKADREVVEEVSPRGGTKHRSHVTRCSTSTQTDLSPFELPAGVALRVARHRARRQAP